MSQMYKVFFNNNTLFLANKAQKNIQFDLSHSFVNKKELSNFIFTDCSGFENKTVLILSSNIDKLWETFKSLFKVKSAGGGLVINSQNKILFIKRRGLWDLPKGHQEKGELIADTAIREVTEECGINNLTISKALKTTYHTYWLKGQAILKPGYWYAMQYTGSENGTPQSEEDITEIKWFNAENTSEILTNTFPSIIDVLNDYFEDSLFSRHADN